MADTLTTAAQSGANLSVLSDAILNAYSQEVLFEAQPILRYEQIATRKEELNVLPGLTIQFLRYSALTGGGALTEGTNMQKDSLSSSNIQITVTEYGKAIYVSEKLLVASFDDVMQSAAKGLGQHFAKTRDALLRDTLLGGTNVKYAGQVAGRASLGSSNVFDTALVKDMVEFLATNKAPKINGDTYVCFVHPHQARNLRDDAAWINAKNYAAAREVLTGEVGMYEDVSFIETTQQTYIDTSGNIFADGVDTGSDTGGATPAVNTYQSVMVGDHALGLAISVEAELRDDGVEDFGRKHALGWYGIWGQGLIETGHSVIGESA